MYWPLFALCFVVCASSAQFTNWKTVLGPTPALNQECCYQDFGGHLEGDNMAISGEWTAIGYKPFDFNYKTFPGSVMMFRETENAGVKSWGLFQTITRPNNTFSFPWAMAMEGEWLFIVSQLWADFTPVVLYYRWNSAQWALWKVHVLNSSPNEPHYSFVQSVQVSGTTLAICGDAGQASLLIQEYDAGIDNWVIKGSFSGTYYTSNPGDSIGLYLAQKIEFDLANNRAMLLMPQFKSNEGRFTFIERDPVTHVWYPPTVFYANPDPQLPGGASTYAVVSGLKDSLAVMGGTIYSNPPSGYLTFGVYVFQYYDGTWNYVQKVKPMCTPTCTGMSSDYGLEVVDSNTFCAFTATKWDCYQYDPSAPASAPFTKAYSLTSPVDFEEFGLMGAAGSPDKTKIAITYASSAEKYKMASFERISTAPPQTTPIAPLTSVPPVAAPIIAAAPTSAPITPPLATPLVSAPQPVAQPPQQSPTPTPETPSPEATPEAANTPAPGGLPDKSILAIALVICLLILFIIGLLVAFLVLKWYRQRRRVKKALPSARMNAPTATQTVKMDEILRISDEFTSSDEYNSVEIVTNQ